jgi:hypothetical protein
MYHPFQKRRSADPAQQIDVCAVYTGGGQRPGIIPLSTRLAVSPANEGSAVFDSQSDRHGTATRRDASYIPGALPTAPTSSARSFTRGSPREVHIQGYSRTSQRHSVGRRTRRYTHSTIHAARVTYQDLLISQGGQATCRSKDGRVRSSRYQHHPTPPGSLAVVHHNTDIRSSQAPASLHRGMASSSLLRSTGRRVLRRQPRVLDLLLAATGQSGPARYRSGSMPILHTPLHSEDTFLFSSVDWDEGAASYSGKLTLEEWPPLLPCWVPESVWAW